MSLNASEEKNSATNLKDLNMKKKLQVKQPPLFLSKYPKYWRCNPEVQCNSFFKEYVLTIYVVNLHHYVSNVWVSFSNKNTFFEEDKQILMVLGLCSNIVTWSVFTFFHLRWRHAHFSQFFVAINLRTTYIYCFKCV